MPALSSHAVDVYPYRTEADGTTRWLVLRRAPGYSDAGCWRMVGGKIRDGEAAWQTALRELAEETGWCTGAGLRTMWAVPSVNVFYEPPTDRLVLAPAFAAHVDGDPVLDDEHDAFAWLLPESASDRLAWPEQARLLRLAAGLVGAGLRDTWVVPPRPSAPGDRDDRVVPNRSE